MATCLPKDEFLVAFGNFLVIFYPGMRKNVDVCRLVSDSKHRPWHGVSNLRYSLDRRGTWQSWTHYSAIRKTWGVTKTLMVTAGRRRQSYPKTHIGTSKLRSEVSTVWRICDLKGSYLHRGNDSTWCSRSGFAVECASGVAVFPHLVSVVILRAQTWNGLPNLTCCKGKLIAVQIVKSNQSTAAISVSN